MHAGRYSDDVAGISIRIAVTLSSHLISGVYLYGVIYRVQETGIGKARIGCIGVGFVVFRIWHGVLDILIET